MLTLCAYHPLKPRPNYAHSMPVPLYRQVGPTYPNRASRRRVQLDDTRILNGFEHPGYSLCVQSQIPDLGAPNT